MTLSGEARALLLDMLKGPIFLSNKPRWATDGTRRQVFLYTRSDGGDDTPLHAGEAVAELNRAQFLDLGEAQGEIILSPEGRAAAENLKGER